ncbi:MAG: DUF4347 domain-containing protein, partial [Microcoleus sp.]
MNKQILFVDSSVQDYQSLIDGIDRAKIFILNENFSAIEQITHALAGEKDIEAIHILSHGAPGILYLGNTQLSLDTLSLYANQLQQWGLTTSQILLYGCSVAAGDAGAEFIEKLHQLPGANIAANPQPTGNAEKGGNWDIRQLIPPSPQRPQLALTETSLKTYSGVLGLAPKVDFTTGSSPRSVSIGDFNGDGKPDLALGNYSSNTASILLNTTTTGATTPTFATKVDFTTGSNPFS